MAGQKRHQVLRNAHRAHAGAAAAMGNAESFVQVQVADVTAKSAGCCQTDQSIHIGAVYIHPATVLVYQLTQRAHRIFKHAVGAGVGDHDAGQLVAVGLAFGLQIGHVDIALRVARYHHHLHAAHLGAGRVGAMGTGGNQADGALRLAARCMPGTDG